MEWVDSGGPVLCQELGEANQDEPEPPALDPAVFTDEDGSQWMVYGGAHIWLVEIDPETGELASAQPESISLSLERRLSSNTN